MISEDPKRTTKSCEEACCCEELRSCAVLLTDGTADYHVHSTFSDGNSSLAEVAEEAAARGMKALGISDHSYTFFDESYCIPKEKLSKYKAELAELRKKYSYKLQILTGVEQDYYSAESTEDYDYAVGSVHYVAVKVADGDDVVEGVKMYKVGDEITAYIPVDESPVILHAAVQQYFGGDFYAFCEAYFKNVGNVAERTGCDIIGHFDLVSKFNEKMKFFDENDPRYAAAWKKAADKLLLTGRVFEINTGAIARGYRTDPYPAKPMRDYIRERGGSFILSSDSHHRDTLRFKFEEYLGELQK